MFLMLVGVESRIYYKQMPSEIESCGQSCLNGWSNVHVLECYAWFAQSYGSGSIWSVSHINGHNDCILDNGNYGVSHACICKTTCDPNQYLVENVCTTCNGVVVVGVSEDVCVPKDDLKEKYNEVECSRL